jgi:hypothetical protein
MFKQTIVDRFGVGRLAELCKRTNGSTVFERTSEGENHCGPEGRFWLGNS